MKQESHVNMVSQSCRFRVSPVVGVRRVVATLLMYTITVMVTAPAFADNSPALGTRPVEIKLWSIGPGQHVAVRLACGHTVRGRIASIDASSFTLLSPHDGKRDRVIPYSFVADVKSKHPLLPWILAGVVVGAVVLIVVVHGTPASPYVHGK